MQRSNPAVDDDRPPRAMVGPVAWVRDNLFNSLFNSALTIFFALAVGYFAIGFFKWAWLTSTFLPDAEICRKITGACWGFITEKWRFVLFGRFPPAEQWRPFLMMILLIGLCVGSVVPALWGRWLILGWPLGIVAMYVLMAGGVLGLTPVAMLDWGGLPVTLILAVTGVVFSFPLAIGLALGRRSRMPIIKALSIGFIEVVRGVPLITILFMSNLMLPLFLPEGARPAELVRAQVAFVLFAAAYVAEVIRGGLQAIPRGQVEAADALGLSYFQKTSFIVLPQALKLVIPPLINTFIGLFKDTSLVIIVSMYDLLGTTRAAANDPEWRRFYIEGLIFTALIYFVFCYAMARYSKWLEGRLNTTR